MYGGTWIVPSDPVVSLGLSPRVRGNRAPWRSPRAETGSIPACTGEPTPPDREPGSPGVYPRVYGGTTFWARSLSSVRGLSPRVRGNRKPGIVDQERERSIPACTGEPTGRAASGTGGWVYPRVYGGTLFQVGKTLKVWGLSPRVRGNLPEQGAGTGAPGSIPACTGEPSPGRTNFGRWWVYPRVYGGTLSRIGQVHADEGLSPRVRGNPEPRAPRVVCTGSIPACTGEPNRTTQGCGCSRVYPRVYGGTFACYRGPAPLAGLSPRVRGNLTDDAQNPSGLGSIPACTGEPGPQPRRRPAAGVYPRVYGGTLRLPSFRNTAQGLSPRVRGNRGEHLPLPDW